MAIQPTPQSSAGIWGAVKGALGIFGDTNKAEGFDENSGGEPIGLFESTLKDEELLALTSQWRKTYGVYFDPISKTQQLAFNYWIGKHNSPDAISAMGNDSVTDSTKVTDNLMFEAIETFLPIATRSNPDPLVSADPSELGQQIAKDLKVALVNEADRQKLRRILAKQTRHWILYRIGVGKLSWDASVQEIKTEIINARRIILDPDGWVDEGGRFHGEYIGEKKKLVAEDLIAMFPKHEAYITQKAQGKLGTKLEFYEWWYRGTDVFYELDEKVLGKYKNPHWNYDGESEEVDPETGAKTTQYVQGTNHFKEPTAPYVFLTMFNTGLHPHDDTSLILQNIPIQDLINRRYKQIDDNIQGMNNGMAVDGRAFTEEQAAQAAAAARRGIAFRVPTPVGSVRDAVVRLPAPALPSDVPNNLNDARGELRNIFGTSGSTPQSTQREDTVRGKVLVAQQDTSRIGGGISEQLEQVADAYYNWWVQLMYVYYDEEHFFTTAGAQGGMELVTMKNDRFPLLKTLQVTVKEGSLIPKNPLAQRNEAIDLWSANAIDPINFYKALDMPDPLSAAKQLITWQMVQKGALPPDAYIPGFSQGMQQDSGLAPVPGAPVNDLDASQPQVGAPVPGSPDAVTQESQQLFREATP